MRPPAPGQIYSFSCSFREKWSNNRLPPLMGWCPLGNPGSATMKSHSTTGSNAPLSSFSDQSDLLS